LPLPRSFSHVGAGCQLKINKNAAGDTASLLFRTGFSGLGAFEEGTFTPTLFGATAAGTTTYTIQDGSYTRIGNRVFGNGRVIWSNATGTGSARIGGLPFTVASGGQNRGMVSWQYYHSLSMPAGNFPGGYPEPGQAYITLRKVTESSMSGAADMTEVSTGGEFYFTFMYRI
jgi:hypothetical protein